MSPRMNPQGQTVSISICSSPTRALLSRCSRSFPCWNLANARQVEHPLSLLIAYLGVAVVILLLERMLRRFQWHLPLVCDVLVLGFSCIFRRKFCRPGSCSFSWRLPQAIAGISNFRCSFALDLLLLAMALEIRREEQAASVRTM